MLDDRDAVVHREEAAADVEVLREFGARVRQRRLEEVEADRADRGDRGRGEARADDPLLPECEAERRRIRSRHARERLHRRRRHRDHATSAAREEARDDVAGAVRDEVRRLLRGVVHERDVDLIAVDERLRRQHDRPQEVRGARARVDHRPRRRPVHEPPRRVDHVRAHPRRRPDVVVRRRGSRDRVVEANVRRRGRRARARDRRDVRDRLDDAVRDEDRDVRRVGEPRIVDAEQHRAPVVVGEHREVPEAVLEHRDRVRRDLSRDRHLRDVRGRRAHRGPPQREAAASEAVVERDVELRARAGRRDQRRVVVRGAVRDPVRVRGRRREGRERERGGRGADGQCRELQRGRARVVVHEKERVAGDEHPPARAGRRDQRAPDDELSRHRVQHRVVEAVVVAVPEVALEAARVHGAVLPVVIEGVRVDGVLRDVDRGKAPLVDPLRAADVVAVEAGQVGREEFAAVRHEGLRGTGAAVRDRLAEVRV